MCLLVENLKWVVTFVSVVVRPRNKTKCLTFVLDVALDDVMKHHYSMHYCTLGSCPVIIAYGPWQTGKSTTISIALSLIGKL